MSLKGKESSLTRLTKKLIMMNGQHQTTNETKASGGFYDSLFAISLTRQSRRQRRRQAHLEALEATDGSSDESPHLAKSQGVPRKPIYRLAKLIQFLDSYECDVGQIEGALGELMAKDEKINSLSNTAHELQLSVNEISARLQEETARSAKQQMPLDEQERRLKSAEQALEQEQQQTRKAKQNFQEEYKARYEKAVEKEKIRFAENSESRIAEIKKDVNLKLQQANGLRQKLEGDVQQLAEEKGRHEKTLQLYMRHSKQMEAEKDELTSRYSLQTIPITQYKEDFDKLHNTVKTIVCSYFRELPPENLDVDMSQSLRHLDDIFQYIPITTSKASEFLRVCGVQSIIMKAICRCIWQQFSATAMSISSEVKDTFRLISSTIGQKDRSKEALWRSLTYEGLIPISQSPDQIPECERVLQKFKAISDVLTQFIPLPRQRAFQKDLKALLTECIALWDKAKRDSCMIEFDLEPPQLCGPGWVSDSCPEIDTTESGTRQGRDIKTLTWCLFPRVIFKPVSADQEIATGSAIFVDSPALQTGLNELRCQEEEIAQVRRNFARRPSISKSKKTS